MLVIWAIGERGGAIGREMVEVSMCLRLLLGMPRGWTVDADALICWWGWWWWRWLSKDMVYARSAVRPGGAEGKRKRPREGKRM